MTLEEVNGECPSFFISKQSCALAIVFQVLSPSFKPTKQKAIAIHPILSVVFTYLSLSV